MCNLFIYYTPSLAGKLYLIQTHNSYKAAIQQEEKVVIIVANKGCQNANLYIMDKKYLFFSHNSDIISSMNTKHFSKEK